MPDFTIKGNPGNVRAKALLMEQKGRLFFDTGDALSRIDTSGWTGRAADTFRDAHDLEPDRWFKAGNGFTKASAALTTYAGALEAAQQAADAAREEYARGEQETQRARASYDDYLGRVQAYRAAGGSMTVEPFVDTGQPIRDQAVSALHAAKADLDAAAHTCAGEVRAGCADAPEEPNWFESGLRFVGGVLEGAGEAIWDLLTMVPVSPVNMVMDYYKMATGELTAEELMKKYELSAESAWNIAQGMYAGITTDPIGFGKELGKSLLDWDTWADDPARALGHLVPDAIAAAATAGTGALATRGIKGGADVLDGLADLNRLEELSDLRHLDNLDELSGLNRFDGPPERMWEWTGSGRRDPLDQLRDPSYSPSNRDIVDGDYDVLGGRSTPEEFHDEFYKPTGDPDHPYDWDWSNAAPNEGRVPGSERILDPGDLPEIDRIGGPGGEYFGRDGDSMAERSLPPDRLNFERRSWEIDPDHPSLRDGSIRIEESEVAPAFGQDGGGLQYRFLDEDGKPLSQGELKAREIIRQMDELRVHPRTPDAPVSEGFDPRPAAAAALATHGLQSLDRFLTDYALPLGAGTR